MFYHQPTNSKGNYNYDAAIYTNGFWQPHFHSNYELIYVIEGNLNVKLNNIDFKLEKGELLLINPNVIHSFITPNTSLIWVGVFSNDFVWLFSKKYGNTAFNKFRCDSKIEEFLKEKLFIRDEQERFLTIGYLNIVISQCLKNSEELQTLKLSGKLASILEYISNHFCEKISLKSMACELGYEYHYLSSIFNNYFNMNFKSYINLYRFQYACELLTNTDIDIIEVAYQSGFQTLRNFNRIFKELSGYTPSSYRKEINKSEKR